MSTGTHSLRRSLLSIAARVSYHSGLLRGLRLVANRLEPVSSSNGTASFPFVRRRKNGNVQILTYHRVTPEPDEFLPSMYIDGFKRQMEYLASSCHVMALPEAVEAIEQCAVPDNAVVITFDDGYRDNYDHAYPILRSLRLRATIFLSSGVVGTDDILWHDRVFRAFHRSELSRLDGFDLDDPGQRQSAREAVLTSLKMLDSRQRRERIDELVGRLEVAEPASQPRVMLGWAEVREMARNGIGFGSHTVTHPVLSRISPGEARREIVESKRDIESNLQMRIDSFAYPNGKSEDYDPFIKQTLKDAGYRCAVTTRFGTNQIDRSGNWDPFELRRGGPEEASTAIFAAKLNLYKLMT